MPGVNPASQQKMPTELRRRGQLDFSLMLPDATRCWRTASGLNASTNATTPRRCSGIFATFRVGLVGTQAFFKARKANLDALFASAVAATPSLAAHMVNAEPLGPLTACAD